MCKKGSILFFICSFCLLFWQTAKGLSAEEISHSEAVATISVLGNLPEAVSLPKVLPAEEISERLHQESTPQIISKQGIKRFGLDIFKMSSSVFEPVTEAPVGPDYIIGPGDNIIIELWGKFEAVHNLTVDKDGKVFIPKVGVVHVWGLSFSQLEKLLQEKFSKIFTGFQMNITMGKLRAIKVFVVGEVVRPGSYLVSPLATVFNALYTAGGPNDNGSLRRIKLIRNERVVDEIDFYTFLLKGDKSQDYRLQSGDTIFVPFRGPLAGIGGGIKKPALYELKEKTKLTELIEMAGGVTPEGYLGRVQVERVKKHEKYIVIDTKLSPLYEDKNQDISLEDSDFVIIFPILKEKYQYVDLLGAVLRPGRYELQNDMTVNELLNKGTVLDEAYLQRLDIIRTFKDYHQEIISIDLKRLMGGDESLNLRLQQWDKVIVYSKWKVEPQPTVSIIGLVNSPGTYTLFENMKVSDLILRSGGVTKGIDLLKAEVIRVLKSEQIEILPVDIASLLKPENQSTIEETAGEKASDLKLQPFDRVNVYSVWQPQIIPLVRVEGMVRNSGTYKLTKGMRVHDLIIMAGGLRKEATFLNAEICRMTKNNNLVSFENIPIDIEGAIKQLPQSEKDILLQEDDMLFIRQIPKYELQSTVVLTGEVTFPGIYAITRGEKLSSVLKRANGFTENAFVKGAVFVRKSITKQQEEEITKRFLLPQEEALIQEEAKISGANLTPEEIREHEKSLDKKKSLIEIAAAKVPKGRIVIRVDELNRFANSRYDIVLEDGDSLFVPKVPISVNVIGEVYNPGAILYQQGNSLKYYTNIAGGLTRNADKGAIHIVKADGKVIKKGVLGITGRKVEKGDVIVVPQRTAPSFSWKEIIQPIYQVAVAIAAIANVFK